VLTGSVVRSVAINMDMTWLNVMSIFG
jgi:hypothetical protein